MSQHSTQAHPLLRSLRERMSTGRATGRFFAGLLLPLRIVGLLARHRRLWPWVLWPALITLVLFAVLLVATLWAGDALFGAVWPRPEERWMLALWWVVRVLEILVGVLLAYLATMILGGVVASPFNDALSERVEAILLGTDDVDKQDKPLLKDLLHSTASSAAVALMYLAVLAPLLLLHLIPVAGSILYGACAASLGAFFLALEYTDSLLNRRGRGLGDKIGLVWRYRSLTLGLGLGSSALLWIPLLNFLCVPLAVAAGTAVALTIDEADTARTP